MGVGAASVALAVTDAGRLDPSLPPVSLLPTSVLGERVVGDRGEALGWGLESRAADGGLVRQGTLDELERRDPVGFARWLAAGHGPAGNPGEFLRDDRPTRTGAAGRWIHVRRRNTAWRWSALTRPPGDEQSPGAAWTER